MKFAVLGLLCLGLLAATSAALLVSTLRIAPALQIGAADATDAEVLVAVSAVPAMTVVDAKQVTTKHMPRTQAPRGYISNPVDVVGKVLAISMVEGQAFTGNCFAQGAGSQLAAALPRGKRAVGISVTDYAGLDGLLYPGSVVDVMFSLKTDSTFGRAANRGAVTGTLLQGVEVLAIERQTVVSPGDKVVDSDPGLRPNNNMRKVTLLVDTRQAKILQLAMEQGTLSLALRNPLDGSKSEAENVSLADLTGIAPEPDPTPRPPSAFQQAIVSLLLAWKQKAEAIATVQRAPPAPTTKPADPFVNPQQRGVTIIRGDKEETRSFPIASDSDAPATGNTGVVAH
jgi:pilus assembly protein CpaB